MAFAEVIFQEIPSKSNYSGLSVKQFFVDLERETNISATLATVPRPAGFVKPFAPSSDGCTTFARTSRTAVANGCSFAVNGAPYNMETAAAAGPLVSDGEYFDTCNLSPDAATSFAITSDETKYALGELANLSSVSQAIGGFSNGFLVKNGSALESSSTLIAPRTAVGINAQGELLILVVDGVEDLNQGMNLTELALTFVDLNATYAINLDGGGSTTAFYDGKVINQPTCDDTGRICERRVSSILCVLSDEAAKKLKESS